MVKLKTEYKENSIPVSELKEGQIGAITHWYGRDEYMGVIIQKYKSSLVRIGDRCGESWDNIPMSENCRVRVLEKGTELIVTGNQ